MASPAASPIKLPFPLSPRELVVMLAFSQALQALAIDAILPALGEVSRELAVTDPNRQQLVVGLFLIGIALGSLIPGTLADRFGRRPVLLGSVISCSVIGGLCALSRDFTMLLVLRFLGGLLSGGLSAVGSAILRDRFEGDRMASTQSLIFVVFMVVPMLAPSIGQGVMLLAGWRWIFGVTALLGAAMGLWITLRLPESLAAEFRQPISFQRIFGSSREVLLCRESIGYVLAGSLTLLFGIDPIVSLRDNGDVAPQGIPDVLGWAAYALVRAALSEPGSARRPRASRRSVSRRARG